MTAIKERPIILRDWEVNAVREGRKTQKRFRIKDIEDYTDVVKILDPSNDMLPFWRFSLSVGKATQCHDMDCPHGRVGDLLWAQEAWRVEGKYTDSCSDEEIGINPSHFSVWHQANVEFNDDFLGKIRPPAHMPRWASRLLLEIEDVRVERIHEISEADAIAEGAREWLNSLDGRAYDNAERLACRFTKLIDPRAGVMSNRGVFATLWESLHGKGSWAANPWAWAITFREVGK